MAAGNKKSYKNNTSKNGTSKNAASKRLWQRTLQKVDQITGHLRRRMLHRKTSARSKAAIERKAREEELARQKQMRSEIILIVLFAFSVFLLLANFRICGIVGDTVSGFSLE